MRRVRVLLRRGLLSVASAIPFFVAAVVCFLIVLNLSISFCPSKQERAGRDLEALRSALTLYRARHGDFPSTGEGFQPLVDATILDQHPLDPWGHPYGYELRGDRPRVWSLGADGTAGGEGEDADHFLPEHP